MVRTDPTGHGTGSPPTGWIVADAKTRGLKEIVGEVRWTNAPMLKLCDRIGFTRHRDSGEAGTVEVRLSLERRKT